MINIFNLNEANTVIQRINNLKSDASPIWGEMSVEKMLAHCNVAYEMALENMHPKPSGFKKIMLKLFVKPIVVSKKPYSRNSRTSPEFLITDEKHFELEKVRLTNYVLKTIELGEDYFDNRESHSFGKLKKTEWNNMFYKHLDHHLSQFGV